MTAIVNLVILVGLSYLVGSVPTAFWFGKVLKGLDIREYGSGNVGATNAFRVLGKGPGTLVLIIDMVKGLVPVVFLASWLVPGVEGRIAAAIGAVCGHNWTIFLNFKGGKGVATTAGVLIGLTVALPMMRWPVGLCLLGWIVTFLMTGYISVASLTAAVLLPVLMVVFAAPFPIALLSILFCIFVIFRHRPNIYRLLNGQENRVPLPFHKKEKA